MGVVKIESPNSSDSYSPIIEKADDIDSLLEGYNESMVIDNTDTERDGQNGVPDPGDPGSDNYRRSGIDINDKSNSDIYYVRGAKKGQRKPNWEANLRKKGHYGKSSVSGELISGILFITIIDQLFPAFIAFANNRFSKDKIKAQDMQLTSKQKGELAPICDDIIRQWEITANPVLILVLSMSGIYGMNYLSLKGS